jgi:hypothetical protein
MDRFERQSLDDHITGHGGEDQLRDDGRPFDPADYFFDDPDDYSGVFDGFGVVSDADPGL